MFSSKTNKPLARKELRKDGWGAAEAFFVLSTGRCGTRTLASILDLGSNAFVQHEPVPRMNNQCREVYEQWENNPEFYKTLIETCREDFIYEAYEEGRIYGETANRLTNFAPAINAVFTNSKFIHLVRDPRDVVRSGMDRGWYAGHKWDEGRIVPRPGDPYYDRWAEMTLFEKCSWLWFETNRFAQEFVKSLPPDRTFTLKSEGLFDGEFDGLKQIFDFVGVEIPRSRLIQKILKRKENYQRRRSFPAKEQWTDEQNAALRAVAGPLMEVFGY